ncbi:MAG: lysine--tRNA ligase [Bacilli bacterium]|jgi:lysyl-tRNA synthetase class 2
MSLTEQEIVRREKLSKLREKINPYPERYEITHELFQARELGDGEKGIRVAGRIVLLRKMGKLTFIVIRDVKADLQVLIKSDVVGEDKHTFFKSYFDIGDFIGVEGEMFTTKTGEKTIRADDFVFLGKALKPLPEKFHGLADAELRGRYRYVDLIVNEDSRRNFLLKFEFIKQLRRYLEDLGYIEIETPVLNNIHSGALARPFKTYHNTLKMELYLRIAPETYLKRAVVGGFNKVFEVARCFRNEGIGPNHLQDFTMVEGYGAYLNYKDNMKLMQEMLTAVINKVFGSTTIDIKDRQIDLLGEWPIVTFRGLILKYANIDIDEYNTREKLITKIKQAKIELESETPIDVLGFGNLVDLLYKKVARPKIINPTFLTEHPTEVSPLARANDNNPSVTDRFQLIINGAEIVNAYSELVDPIEQRKRLEAQAQLNKEGDEEAMVMDNDYINAMEYGMPPISGWGMGIDRIIQILTNSDNIKDCVLFPLLKPEDKTD